jgi:hypothetical protein
MHLAMRPMFLNEVFQFAFKDLDRRTPADALFGS